MNTVNIINKAELETMSVVQIEKAYGEYPSRYSYLVYDTVKLFEYLNGALTGEEGRDRARDLTHLQELIYLTHYRQQIIEHYAGLPDKHKLELSKFKMVYDDFVDTSIAKQHSPPPHINLKWIGALFDHGALGQTTTSRHAFDRPTGMATADTEEYVTACSEITTKNKYLYEAIAKETAEKESSVAEFVTAQNATLIEALERNSAALEFQAIIME